MSDSGLRDTPLRELHLGLGAKMIPFAGFEMPVNIASEDDHISVGRYDPSDEGPVAMGYVKSEFAAPNMQVEAIVRGRALQVRVAKLPPVAAKYYRG